MKTNNIYFNIPWITSHFVRYTCNGTPYVAVIMNPLTPSCFLVHLVAVPVHEVVEVFMSSEGSSSDNQYISH